MNDIFQLRLLNHSPRDMHKLKLEIRETNQVKFGKKNLRTFSPKIWNSLPHHKKSAENLVTLKRIIKDWNGAQCECTVQQNKFKLMW